MPEWWLSIGLETGKWVAIIIPLMFIFFANGKIFILYTVDIFHKVDGWKIPQQNPNLKIHQYGSILVHYFCQYRLILVQFRILVSLDTGTSKFRPSTGRYWNGKCSYCPYYSIAQYWNTKNVPVTKDTGTPTLYQNRTILKYSSIEHY